MSGIQHIGSPVQIPFKCRLTARSADVQDGVQVDDQMVQVRDRDPAPRNHR